MSRQKKTCYQMKSLFSEAFDRQLSAADEERFGRHLGQCSDCKVQYEVFSTSVDRVRSLDSAHLSETFTFSLMERIERRPVFVWGRQAFAGAMLVALLTFSPGGKDQQVQVQLASRQPVTAVDYVDAASLQPIQLDYVLHRAVETNRKLRFVPLVRAMDAHRQALVETATYIRVRDDLSRYGDAASNVEIDAPIQMDTGSYAPFVVAIEEVSR